MKNIIFLVTGDGKGKTTSAVGQALRYKGAGKKVLFVQFFKKGDSSEIRELKKISVEVLSDPLSELPLNLEDRETIERQLKLLNEAAAKCQAYDAVILDEFNLLTSSKLTHPEKLKEILLKMKEYADLYLTGRNAPEWLIELADTVSIIKNLKHHYEAGIQAEEGREY